LVNGYTATTSSPTNNAKKNINDYNSKGINAILSGLTGSKFVKVMHCDSTKEIWDKLKNVYEGYVKVKGAKIHTYRGQFEHLIMKEDKDIATYFLWVDEIVNTIIGLGENLKIQLLLKIYWDLSQSDLTLKYQV